MSKKKLKIAIQGIATSFHEVAALTYFQDVYPDD
jgi:prephenate dehydratase